MVNWDELKEGEIGTSLTYGPLMRAEFKVYADAGGDQNPIHQDEFAGLFNKGVIAHGLYTHAMIGKMLTDWVGAENVRKYGGRMVGMTRPGDIVTFKAIVKKKYEKDGEKLVDLDIITTTKTYYLRGKAKCDSNINDEEILKILADTPIKINIDFTATGEKKHELIFEPKDIETRRKDLMADEPLVRDWIRIKKDVITAEFVGKVNIKKEKDEKTGEDIPVEKRFKFGIVRNRDSIVGTGIVAIK